MNSLIKKIKDKSCLVGIIGLGYVGLPLALVFCRVGYKVIGFDKDENKVELLNTGQSYIKHISSHEISTARNKGFLEASADFGRLNEPDVILICLPTPLTVQKEPDLSYIKNAASLISVCLRPTQLVVLESTTYPGTTNDVILPVLSSGGLVIGKDFFLAYSPEREDPGNPKFKTSDIPKVVGGTTESCLNVAKELYSKIVKVVPVSSTRAAEATKLLENIYRAVNIAMVNEMKILFDRMGIDVWEVIDASSTKPFGFQPFYPGPGLGGHCIPIDPFYLSWKAREYDFTTRFIQLAGEINTSMPYYVVEKTSYALNARGISVKGACVLVLGIAYKKDIDDQRESPALKIIQLLSEREAEVSYHDPYVPYSGGHRAYPGWEMASVELTEENVKDYDCVIIVTDHSCIDYNWLMKKAKLIVDTRNCIGVKCANIVNA